MWGSIEAEASTAATVTDMVHGSREQWHAGTADRDGCRAPTAHWVHGHRHRTRGRRSVPDRSSVGPATAERALAPAVRDRGHAQTGPGRTGQGSAVRRDRRSAQMRRGHTLRIRRCRRHGETRHRRAARHRRGSSESSRRRERWGLVDPIPLVHGDRVPCHRRRH